MSTRKRPGLARTDRGVSRPLRAWLSRALEDNAALEDLALAWSAHPVAERRQLVSLLFRDVEAEGVDPTRAQALFAAMLALEEERTLQAELLTKLQALEPVVAAFVYGDALLGGAVVARERAPSDWECLLVDWRDERATRVSYTEVSANVPSEVLATLTSRAGGVSASSRPSIGASEDTQDVNGAEPSAAPDAAWQEVDTSQACQRLALPLLRFTRHGGQLPAGAERFASVVTRG